jgi:hypothetical protein
VLEGKVTLLSIKDPKPVQLNKAEEADQIEQEIVKETEQEASVQEAIVQEVVQQDIKQEDVPWFDKEIEQDVVQEIVEPIVQEVVEVKKQISSEESLNFMFACEKYDGARLAKSEANNEFKVVDQDTRPIIVNYLEKYGQETELGKNDLAVEAGEFKAYYVIIPGKVTVKRDEEKIIRRTCRNMV